MIVLQNQFSKLFIQIDPYLAQFQPLTLSQNLFLNYETTQINDYHLKSSPLNHTQFNYLNDSKSQNDLMNHLDVSNYQGIQSDSEIYTVGYFCTKSDCLGQQFFDFMGENEPFDDRFQCRQFADVITFQQSQREELSQQENFDLDQGSQAKQFIFPEEVLILYHHQAINLCQERSDNQPIFGKFSQQGQSEIHQHQHHEIMQVKKCQQLKMNNQEQKQSLKMSNRMIPEDPEEQILSSAAIHGSSALKKDRKQRNIGDKQVRVMNDMMRQTFVALQFSIDDIVFPQNYATLQGTKFEIRSLFDILKKFMNSMRRKFTGGIQVKSIPMKKAAMILFNQVNIRLNRDIRHIKIQQIQAYLYECQRVDEGIMNEAKYLFRKVVARLMSRSWIYQMSLRAKFSQRNQKPYCQFLQKYMQHVAVQLSQGQINPKAFDRDYIIQNYSSLIDQNKMPSLTTIDRSVSLERRACVNECLRQQQKLDKV